MMRAFTLLFGLLFAALLGYGAYLQATSDFCINWTTLALAAASVAAANMALYVASGRWVK